MDHLQLSFLPYQGYNSIKLMEAYMVAANIIGYNKANFSHYKTSIRALLECTKYGKQRQFAIFDAKKNGYPIKVSVFDLEKFIY